MKHEDVKHEESESLLFMSSCFTFSRSITKNARRGLNHGGRRQKVGRGASCQMINPLSHRTLKLIAST